MKCLKCENNIFDKRSVAFTSLDKDSKYIRSECKFDLFICKTCKLIQLFDHYIVSGEKEAEEKQYEEGKYSYPVLDEFKCINCRSSSADIRRVKPFEKSTVSKYIAYEIFGIASLLSNADWEGEILLRVCDQCGLAEVLEIMLVPPSGANASVRDRSKLAQAFICAYCKSTIVSQTGQLSFWGINPDRPKYRQSERRYYLFATCQNCKRMMISAYC